MAWMEPGEIRKVIAASAKPDTAVVNVALTSEQFQVVLNALRVRAAELRGEARDSERDAVWAAHNERAADAERFREYEDAFDRLADEMHELSLIFERQSGK